MSADHLAEDYPHLDFTLDFAPMGKPRMTQRDKWKKRPAVLRYHKWKDSVSFLAPKSRIPWDRVFRIDWVAYFPIPKSWSKARTAEMAGERHRVKPDRDNIDKALLDALLKEDSIVSDTGKLLKRWDDGKGPRMEVTVWWLPKETTADARG